MIRMAAVLALVAIGSLSIGQPVCCVTNSCCGSSERVEAQPAGCACCNAVSSDGATADGSDACICPGHAAPLSHAPAETAVANLAPAAPVARLAPLAHREGPPAGARRAPPDRSPRTIPLLV